MSNQLPPSEFPPVQPAGQPAANPYMYVEAKPVYPDYAPRPTWLTAICVIAIVLGALWVLMSLLGVAGLATSNSQFGMNGDPQLRALQEEMQQKLREAIGLGYYAGWVMVVFQGVLAGCLLVGGIQSFNQKDFGRRFLYWTCLAAIVYLVLYMIVLTINTMATASVTGEYMVKMMEVQQKGAAGPSAKMMADFARIGALIGVVITGVIALAEGAYFGFAAKYLADEEVQKHFTAE